MGRPGGLAGLERGWRTSRGAARRAPRATLGLVLIKFLLRAADYAAIASVPAGLKWKPGVEPGFFWSQVRSGSISTIPIGDECVRFTFSCGTRLGHPDRRKVPKCDIRRMGIGSRHVLAL